MAVGHKLQLNKIYTGDALDVLQSLPNDCVDVGVTSPPYNKGEIHKGWLVKNVKYDKSSDKTDEVIYQDDQARVLNEIYRVTKPGGSFFYNHKTRWQRGIMSHPIEWLSKTKWTIRQEIIWDRMIAANIRGWRFWQIDERIYWLYKPIGNNQIGKELNSKHALLTSIWRFTPERNNGHPAPFPLVLPARAISSVLDGSKGVVLDPYAGSGTTLVATKLLGCDYIGIEISKKYVEQAEQRLSNSEIERSDLEQELAKHFVMKTFKERKLLGEHTGKFKGISQVELADW